MTINDLIPVIKTDYPSNYFGEDVIGSTEAIDPLARVIPCFTDQRDFFGPFVCNFLVFTKLLLNNSGGWDSQVDNSKLQLIETFGKFARYELHIFIDTGADDIQTASGGDINNFENKLIALATELAGYNVTYHGRFQDDQLKNAIEEVIGAFNASISSP